MSKAQFKVVAGALRDRSYLKEVIPEKNLIVHEELNNLFKLGKSYYKDNNRFPTSTVMKDLIEDKVSEEKKKRYNKLIDKVFSTEVNDTDFYHFYKQAKEERKDRFVKSGIANVINSLEKGEKDKAEERLLKLAGNLRKSGNENRIIRVDAIDDGYMDYYLQGEENLIETSLATLNRYLGGGNNRGDLVLWQAGTGRGKSMALLEQADYSFNQGLDVLVFVVEMFYRRFQDRIVSKRTNTLYSTVKKGGAPPEVIQKERDKIQSARNSFQIVDVPIGSSTETIRLETEEFIQENGNVDVIIVDPVYMINALADKDAAWEEKGSALLELKQIGMDFNAVLHTANQIKNKYLQTLEPDTDSSSQSFLYGAGTDVMINIAMNQELKKKNIAKIYVPKAREGESGVGFYIKTKYSNMTFCERELDIEEVKQEGEDF